MYQTMAIFQKSFDFLEWEPISLNNEIYILYLPLNSIKLINSGFQIFSLNENFPIQDAKVFVLHNLEKNIITRSVHQGIEEV